MGIVAVAPAQVADSSNGSIIIGFRHSTFGRVADLRPLASMDCALVGWSRGLLACDSIFMNCIGAVCTEILLLSALVDGSSHMAPSLAGCDEPPGTPLKQFVAQVQASAPKKAAIEPTTKSTKERSNCRAKTGKVATKF